MPQGCFPLPSITRTMMTVWRTRGTITRAVLCITVVHNDTHTATQSSSQSLFCVCLGITFCVFLCFSVGYFVLVLLFASVVLGLVSSVLRQDIEVVVCALLCCSSTYQLWLWSALCNRADHYIFALSFLSSFFFPHLISAVANWISTILPHMVWP